MATTRYIRGLTRAGFRVNSTATSGLSRVTLSGTTQVDIDDHKTQLVLAGNRNTGAFVRVSGSGATTATINALSRRGFRIPRSSDGKYVQAVLGGFWIGGAFTSGPVTVDLTNRQVQRVLLREKRNWYFAASPTALLIKGIQNEQNGFEVCLGDKATATLTQDGTTTLPAAGETVTINDKTYRWEATMALANDVKIGADVATSFANLVLAVNQTGTAGVNYFAGTTAPTGVTAGSVVGTGAGTHVTFTATAAGLAANAFASTETMAHASFGGATFSGGGANVGNSESNGVVKVYRGQAVTLDATQPFNYQQLRRHYDRWIEG